MDYANLSQKPSPSVTEHSLKSSKIPRRPSSRIHDASLVNCDSIVMERCEISLKSPLSVTSGPLSRKPGNVNNQHVEKEKILENFATVPRPDSPSVHDTTMRYEDLFPRCLDLLPLLDDQTLSNGLSKNHPLDTVMMRGGTSKRGHKFVLQPRSQPEVLGAMTFLDFDTEGIPPKRQKLMGSFVSLDAEARPCTNDGDSETRQTDCSCITDSSTTAPQSTGLPLGNTISLPVVYGSTIPMDRSEVVKDDDTKSRNVFQPSRYSAFSFSGGLRRNSSTSWSREPSEI
jgi:hypothetical protein